MEKKKKYVSQESVEKELDRMLTVAEAAELLGVSKSTIRRLSTLKEIKSYRIGTGKHRRFRKRDLYEYLERNNV